MGRVTSDFHVRWSKPCLGGLVTNARHLGAKLDLGILEQLDDARVFALDETQAVRAREVDSEQAIVDLQEQGMNTRDRSVGSKACAVAACVATEDDAVVKCLLSDGDRAASMRPADEEVARDGVARDEPKCSIVGADGAHDECLIRAREDASGRMTEASGVRSSSSK